MTKGKDRMAKITFSGWLPGTEKQGLTDLADEVASAAKDPKRKGPIEYVVISVVRAHTEKRALDAADVEPVYEMRVQAMEVVADADEAAEIRERLVALREHRAGVQEALPGTPEPPADVIPLPGQ